jgi:hypothetical protein
MWEPRHLTNLWVSTACCRDSFIIVFLFLWKKVMEKKEKVVTEEKGKR